MKTNLLKSLFVAAAMIMGTSAWADGQDPAADISYRLNWSGNALQFFHKTPSETGFTGEINWQAQYFLIQQYNVANFKYVKSMTLAIPSSIASGYATDLNVWNFGKNTLETNSANKETFMKNVQNTTGTWFYTVEYPTSTPTATSATTWGTGKTPLATATNSTDNKFTATLTTSQFGNNISYADDKTTARVRLLITTTTPAAAKTKYLTGSKLTVTYYGAYNETTSTGYDDLQAAVNAASANDVISVTSDHAVASQVVVDKYITINGNNYTVTSTVSDKATFAVSSACTVKNIQIIEDKGKAIFEFSNSSDAFTAEINNVTAKDSKVADQGVYRIKDKATVNFTDITNTNVEKTAGYGEICVVEAAAGCKLSGTCGINSVYLEKGKRVDFNNATVSSVEVNCKSTTYQSGYVALQNVNSATTVTTATSGWQAYKSKTISSTKYEYSLAQVINTYDLTVTDAGAATLCLPYKATIPSDVKVYKLNYTSGATATATRVTGTLEANTPVYVIANQGTYTFAAVSGAECTYTEDPTSGALIGSYANSKTLNDKGDATSEYYVLSKETSGVGFYMAKKTKVNQYRAYMKAEAANPGARIMVDFGGETTGINNANVSASAVKSGKFIENGRVVIVKEGKKFNMAGQLIK